MFKKDSDSNKVSFVRQASADVSSNRGRKKKGTPDVSTLSQGFVQKTKKQQVVQIATFSIPANIQGDEDASIQYLNEQLTQVNRDIERLNTKKEQITDLLMDYLQKKKKRQEMRDESDDQDENNKYSFINNSRIRSSSQYGSQKKNMTRFRDDPFHNDDDSYASSQSQKSSKKTNEVSSILNELQTNKSLIKSKIMDSSVFNNNQSVLSHTLQAQAVNDTSNLYQSFMVRDNNSQSLANKQKLDDYNRLKERCLWQHFDYKETIQDKLKNVDNLDQEQLKDLAKNFGVKSKDIKLLKENLKNIYSFLARNKFPDEYLREFKTCIHEKIDIIGEDI